MMRKESMEGFMSPNWKLYIKEYPSIKNGNYEGIFVSAILVEPDDIFNKKIRVTIEEIE